MTVTLPPHGTYTRAIGRGGIFPRCTCPPCSRVEQAQRKRARYNRASGRAFRVDAELTRSRLLLLRKGMTWAAIESAVGVGMGSLIKIAQGQRRWVNRTTHEAVMAVEIKEVVERDRLIDATGTVRRIRALKAMGYSYPKIQVATGVDVMHLFHIADGRCATVRQRTADSVAKAYKQLAFRPIQESRHTTRARAHAASLGWHGPMAWDDNIDDPEAEPDVDDLAGLNKPTRDHLSRDELAAERREWIQRLTNAGQTSLEIAARLGMSVATVRQVRREQRTGKRRDRTQKAVAA